MSEELKLLYRLFFSKAIKTEVVCAELDEYGITIDLTYSSGLLNYFRALRLVLKAIQ